jgi:ferredoxin-NADP reductase
VIPALPAAQRAADPNGPLPLWDPDVDDVLICRAVRTVTPTISTFVLAPRTPQLFRFRAGQHLVFAFDIGGREVLRSYSMSSPPTRPDTVNITVRRRDGGVVSSWLHDELIPGRAVRAISTPLGDFTLEDHPAAAYLLLAAGSGITPFLSMLREMHDTGTDLDVVLAYGARTPAELACSAELTQLAAEIPGVRLLLVPSTAPEDWSGQRGRISADLLRRAVPDLLSRMVLTCGPEPFMHDVQQYLLALGCAADRLHRESFTFADPAVSLALEAAPASDHLSHSGFDVEFRHLGRTVHSPPGSTVLQAAAAAGLTLPSSCSQGLCGTCKSVLVSGEVDMQHGGGIRPKEIARGRFLPCCSVPLTSLVVDRI